MIVELAACVFPHVSRSSFAHLALDWVGSPSATMGSGRMPMTVPMFTLRDYDKRDFESLVQAGSSLL